VAAERPVVFIAHRGTEGVVGDLVGQLRTQLDRGGFEAVFDGDIPRGDDFQEAIDDWIVNCDAAVVILSPQVFDGPYPDVLVEAAKLALREDYFQAVPVYVDGATPDDLTSKYARLTKLSTRNSYIEGGDVRRVATDIVHDLQITRDRLAANELERGLAGLLADVPDVRSIGKGLGLRVGPPELQIAQRLLSPETSGAQAWTVIEKVAKRNDKVARALFNVVMPFKWVDDAAAAGIPAAIQAKRPVAINSEQFLTARAHTVCAYRIFPPPTVHNVNPADGEWVERIRKEIDARRLLADGAFDLDDPAELSDTGAGSAELQVFAVNWGPDVLDLAGDLARPDVALLLLTGDAQLPPSARDSIYALTPALRREREREGLGYVVKFKGLLERLSDLYVV
jgi:hypothetical protein